MTQDGAGNDGKTVREGGPAAPGGGATIREGGHAAPSGGATVREGGRTVREDGHTAPGGGVTMREGGQAAPGGGATMRESPASPPGTSPPPPAPEPQVAGWLPPSLAAKYRLIKPLPASGGEADLYVVAPRDPADTTHRVAKVYRQDIVPKEEVLELVRDTEPAHVVRLEDYGEEAGRWWELMEHMEHGSLRDLIKREGPKLPEGLVMDVLRELNAALAHVHELSLEHRDLKPGNVLVRHRTPLELVLADFGIASVMKASMHFTKRAMTLRYATPQAIGIGKVAIERTTADYWALGMMLVEMLQGEHPYDGLNDGVISERLSSQNFDELSEGITDPRWRKLCRGLLRRTPSDRWGTEAVSKWIADPDDKSLRVAADAAAAGHGLSPTATIDFDGARYAAPADLGAALSRDWDKATSFWKRRFADIRNWVSDGLGDQELGRSLANIDDSDLPLDTQVFHFIYHLAPNAPIRFRNEDITPEGLAALGRRAASDADARITFLALHRQKILVLADGLAEGQGKGLAEVSRRWDEAVRDYERLRRELRADGVDVPVADDQERVTLLAASMPDSPAAETLRDHARSSSTEDARRCPWYRDLGPPDDMPVAALVMLPHLQAPAGREGRFARLQPLRGCIGGVIVGSLFGAMVGWADGGSGVFRYPEFMSDDSLEGMVRLGLVLFASWVALGWYNGWSPLRRNSAEDDES